MEQSTLRSKYKKYKYFFFINLIHSATEFSFVSILGCGIFNVLSGFFSEDDPIPPYVYIFQPLIAGIIQLFVGAWSDRCTHKYGRRRVFVIGGCLLFSIAQFISCILMCIIIILHFISEKETFDKSQEENFKTATLVLYIIMIPLSYCCLTGICIM